MRKTILLSLLAASTLSFGIAQQTGGQTGGGTQTGGQTGGAETGPDPAETEPGVAAQSTTGTGLIFVESRNPGGYIATPEGMTLYTLVDENGEILPCEGDCLAAWPPYTGEAVVDAETGLDPSVVGTTDAADGSQQVTYNGYPLYLFTQDTQPGALAGQGIDAFGGVWYIVSDNGEPLESDPVTGEQ